MTDSAGGILRAAMNEGPDAGADMPVDTGSDAFTLDTPSFDDIGSDPTPGEPVVVLPPKVETPKEPNADPAEVPSWRLREIREERDRIAAENAAFRRQVQEFEEEKRKREEAAKPAPGFEDLIDKPVDFIGGQVKEYLTPFEKRIQEIEERNDKRFLSADYRWVVKDHGEELVGKAVQAAQTMGPEFMARARQEDSPIGAIVDWYQKQELIREYGADPAAARQKFREQALEDPEFLQMALERASSQARPVIERPRTAAGTFTAVPSLNRTTAAQGGDEPATAADTLRQSLRAPRRRAG